MSEITKKQALDELDFLNGEIGKAKIKMADLSKDIEDIELKKANSQVEFGREFALNSSKSKRISDQIIADEAKLTDLKVEIGKSSLILEDKVLEIAAHDKKMAEDKRKHEEEIKAFDERVVNLNTFDDALKKTAANIVESNKLLDERDKVTASRELTNANEATRLAGKQEDIRAFEKRVSDRSSGVEELRRIYDGKLVELDKRDANLSAEKSALLVEKASVEAREAKVSQKEAESNKREGEVSLRESNADKKEAAIIRRETDVVLREGECRVREKALNIATRDKQLDEQI